MIRSPWYMESENLHLLVSGEISTDLIPPQLERYGDTIILTMSRCKSRFNSQSAAVTRYNEFIVKCSVLYEGKHWLYPVISVVDHEDSLVRGAILGFKKIMGNIEYGKDNVIIRSKLIDLDVRYQQLTDDCKYSGSDFILDRDYNFGNGIVSSGFAMLDVENYCILENKKIVATIDEFCLSVNDEAGERIVIDKDKIEEACYLKDTFVLKGVAFI